MGVASVILALIDKKESKKIKAFLQAYNYDIVSESFDGASAIRNIRTLYPDLVICDFNLPGISGVEIAEIVDEDNLSSALVLRNDQTVGDDYELIQKKIAFLDRPITKSGLLQSVQLLLINRNKVLELEDEIKLLKKKLDERKVVEKAKGLLMQKLNISETDAYNVLRKKSMDSGSSIAEIAKAVLLAY